MEAGEGEMKLSTDRILTTHVGSLPRPPDLLAMLEARETGQGFDEAAFEARLARAVREIVEQQVACGIDSVCDGEQSKISYTFYVRHRLSGIGAFQGSELDKPPQTAAHRDILDHPDFAERLHQMRGGTSWFARAVVPCCIGPVAYRDRRPLDTDIKNLKDACAVVKPREAFMNAASPGVLTKFVPDTFYKNEDAYVEALAEALKAEYEAIVAAGFILQIDAPDLGSARHNQYQHLSDDEFLRIADRNIAALNHATANIPPERMRIHICWGN
jgi:5-methyltetrahydropteroyltriglutamate--homocysteine methyltransferase